MSDKLNKNKPTPEEVEQVIRHYIPNYQPIGTNITIPIGKLTEVIQGSYSFGYNKAILKQEK